MNLFFSKRRYYQLAFVIVILIFLTTLVINFLVHLLSLSQRIAEHQIRIKYFESIEHEEVTILLQYLVNLTEFVALTQTAQISSIITSNDSKLSPETIMIFKISQSYLSKYPTISDLPRVQYLPQLLDGPMSLQLSYLVSKHRTGFSIVLGIPTVKRDKANYLMSTLKNITSNMNFAERQETLIVISIGETDMDFITSTAKQIQNDFGEYVDQGLIEIIAPSASYYLNFENLRLSLNDSLKQTKWRSKQNLDVSFLMAYAQSKAEFYVQLEDDIVSRYRYITLMKEYERAMSLKEKGRSLFMLNFCMLGFIGKMFKSNELPWLITYFQMFYDEKPIDWLIYDLYETKVCNCIKPANHCCKISSDKFFYFFQRSLFQHIGLFSSRDGTLRNMTDLTFED